MPNVIGVGEMNNVVVAAKRAMGEHKNGPIAENVCTCGRIAISCPVWQGVIGAIRKNANSTSIDLTNQLIKDLKADHPGPLIIVDSSKELNALITLREFCAHNFGDAGMVSAILLRRNALSWLLSDFRRAARRGRLRNFRIGRRRVQKWRNRYAELDHYLIKNKVQTVRVNLKDFQKNPLSVLDLIGDSLNIPGEKPSILELSRSHSHVIWGSHHRLDPLLNKKIHRQPFAINVIFWQVLGVLISSPSALLLNWRLALREPPTKG